MLLENRCSSLWSVEDGTVTDSSSVLRLEEEEDDDDEEKESLFSTLRKTASSTVSGVDVVWSRETDRLSEGEVDEEIISCITFYVFL